MIYPFGKAITYDYFAIIGDEAVSLADVAAPEGIYLYADGDKPTRAVAAVGGGTPLQTITTWVDVTDGGQAITIAAVTDPEPDSLYKTYTYWLAVNYKLESGAQTQTDLRAIYFARPAEGRATTGIVATDLKDVFPLVDKWVTSADQLLLISNAEEKLRLDLETKGFQWARIWEHDKLQIAAKYKALSDMALALMSESGDQWNTRYVEWNRIYDNVLNSIRIAYANSERDEVVKIEQVNNFRLVIR